jgi:hypothetical protein
MSVEALFEQVSMGSRANEDDLLSVANAAQAIDQQKVAADMAFAMIRPLADQGVIEPLRAEGFIAGYKQQHGLLEPLSCRSGRNAKAGSSP